MQDDWRAETGLRLNESLIYKALQVKCQKDPSGNQVMSLVDEAVFEGFQRTKLILRHMGEFTLHDGDHLFRVLQLMEHLLSPDVIEELSVPELMLLILCAFFHDIGMAPSERAVLSWKRIWDNPKKDEEIKFETKEESDEYLKFKRYYNAHPDKAEEIKSLLAKGKNAEADTYKGYIISDYIRITHADRAREIIDKEFREKIKYRDIDLSVEFAQLCFSHNEDALNLLELDNHLLCAPNVYACLPLLGIILRLSDILDFDAKRTPKVLFSHLLVRHPVSIKEWNKHRSIQAWEVNKEIIKFNAKCSHPAIEAAIHEFCDWIDIELSTCNNLLNKLNEFNRSKGRKIEVKIPYKVNREKISTKTNIKGEPLYKYRQTQFNLNKSQVIDLLMGTKLYGNPEVALRELLQNSIDACLLRKALEFKWGNNYEPEISVRYYTKDEDKFLEVMDNGIGMDQYIIDNYYSRVGSSFYKSADFYELKSDSNANFSPTSRFGIGILSCFMVADTLYVDTRKVYGPHDSSEPISLTVEGQESIFWVKKGERKIPGTTTTMVLRKTKNPWESMLEEDFIASVEKVIPNPPFKISIETVSSKKTRDQKSFINISPDQLKEKYWNKHEEVKEYKIQLTDTSSGIVGSVILFILEKDGMPTNSIELTSRQIEIEGELYDLEKSLNMSNNCIDMHTKTITINAEGHIEDDVSFSSVAKSESKLSLHGIEIPTSLFPRRFENREQVKIKWPCPALMVIDVCGTMDLDLNSSRTQIILSEKWNNFEETLTFLVFSQLQILVTQEYYTWLMDIFFESNLSENVESGLERTLE